jgi:hypothetical protein
VKRIKKDGGVPDSGDLSDGIDLRWADADPKR